jgi:hypothetical protein
MANRAERKGRTGAARDGPAQDNRSQLGVGGRCRRLSGWGALQRCILVDFDCPLACSLALHAHHCCEAHVSTTTLLQ